MSDIKIIWEKLLCESVPRPKLDSITKTARSPHTCPVCKGRGEVGPGFYSGQTTFGSQFVKESCRSCAGTGVVWANK